MVQAQEQVVEVIEVSQDEEHEIVELSLTDLQRVGGGVGNPALRF